jgi:hypothetical protein
MAHEPAITTSRGNVSGQATRVDHEEAIDAARTAPPLGNRPHGERLAALHVARGEHTRHAGHPVGVAPHRAAVRERDTELVEQAAAFGSEETHREQDEVGVERELAVRHRPQLDASTLSNGLHPDAVQHADAPVLA